MPTSPLPPLPDPPFFQRWLLEQPHPLALMLLALGVLAAVVLLRRGKSRVGFTVGGALVAAAVCVWALAAAVTTDRERVLDGTRTMVERAIDGDDAGVGSVISERVTVAVGGATASGVGRETVLGAVRALRDEVDVRGGALLKHQASIDGDGVGRSVLRVRVDVGGVPNFTDWRLHWRREQDGAWRIVTIDWLALNGRRAWGALADEMRRMAR